MIPISYVYAYNISVFKFISDFKFKRESRRRIVRSFKRNDVRIRKVPASKYDKRRFERLKQILHRVSKEIVSLARTSQSAMVFENIERLRNLYKKGNYQGKNFRARMNSVPWNEIKRQIEYKAAWSGVPVLQLTKGESRRTSKDCPVRGERLQEDRFSRVHRRELRCNRCGNWHDRFTQRNRRLFRKKQM